MTLTFLPAVEETHIATVGCLRPMSAVLCPREPSLWDYSLPAQGSDRTKADVAKREMIIDKTELLNLQSGHGT